MTPTKRPASAPALLTRVALGLLLAASAGYAAFALIGPSRRATVAPSPPSGPLTLYRQPRSIPAFRFDNAAGRSLTLADFRGKVLLVNFWATWCVPCRKEMPTLDRLQARLGGKGFQVIAIAQGPTGLRAVRRFFREAGLHHLAPYIDPTMRSVQALGIYGIPTTLLIGRDGRELARKIGAAEWDNPEMIRFLKRRVTPIRTGRRAASETSREGRSARRARPSAPLAGPAGDRSGAPARAGDAPMAGKV